MQRQTTSRTQSSSMGATAAAAAVVIILAVGSSSTTTSAFSPMIAPQATSMVQHRGAIRGNMPTPLPLRLPSLQASNFDPTEEEEFSRATTSSAVQELAPEPQEKKLKNPTPVLVSFVKGLLEEHKPNKKKSTSADKTTTTTALQLSAKQWVAAVAALALAFSPIQDADAAMSGGRMGGSFSSSSISRPAPSRSSYSRGYSHGYSSRPSVTIAPTIVNPGFGYGYGYGNPFYSPFAAPRYYGPGVLAGSSQGGWLGTGLGFVFAGLLLGIPQLLLSRDSATEWTEESSSFSSTSGALGPGTSVVQLSVALDVPDRDDPTSILGALDRLSQTARTDSRVGIQNLSSQVALELLRRRSSIVSASTSTKHFGSRSKALREFENRSIQERSKFEAETVSKFGGVDYGSASSPNRLASSSSSSSSSSNNDKATMAVVTLVLAIDGDSTRLNKIRSTADVEQALQKIASDAKVDDCLQSAEILWTPEDRSETLGLRDVIADYPELRSI